jgi:hypothetical protein
VDNDISVHHNFFICDGDFLHYKISTITKIRGENMKFKTLIYKFNTDYQEFVGWDNNIGWCTSQKPINLFNEDMTIDKIPNIHQFHNIDELKLITVEIKLYE